MSRVSTRSRLGSERHEPGERYCPFTDNGLAPGRPQGIEGTREFLRSARRNVHPVRWIESHVVAEGDLVVQFGTREQHWPGGSFRGFEIPSGIFTFDAAFGYRLVDGRISERWAIRDDLGMMLQLGAIVPAEADPSPAG